MKKKWSRVLSLLLATAMILTAQSGMVSAAGEETEEKTEEGTVTETVSETVDVDTDQLPDNEELLEQYITEQLYPGPGISLYADFGASALTGKSLEVYNNLKDKIETIASNGGSTDNIAVSFEAITWTSEATGDELGVEAGQKLGENIDVSRILTCLLADCPSTFYWYDKTEGTKYSYSYSSLGNEHSISQLVFQMAVAPGYQDNDNPYSVDATKAQEASTAVAKADAIVSKYAGSSDYEKLKGYLTKICDLVSYNSDAASEGYTGGYGDPWQIIYVFDGDASTNVVCEGYAKAFQYLRDKSSFSQDVTCYTVTGTMAGGTGAGGHMWNIVSIDGNNYLVDVTNCDTGSVGYPYQLFLKGNSAGRWNTQYTFTLSQAITYAYDDDQQSLYGENILKLATEDYTPSQEPEPELIDISNANHRVNGPIIYNGTEQRVKVIVEVNGKILESSQYETSFENATNAGTASYTVTGNEAAGYTGTLNGTFEIQKASLTIEDATVSEKTYNGTKEATVTSVTFGGLQQSDNLQLGTDYTASAEFEDAAGGTDKKVTVTVTLGDTTLAKNYELEDNTFETTGTINKIDSQLGLTVDKNNVTYGESVKFTVTPNGKEARSIIAMLQDLIAPPKVSFYAGDVLLGEVSVSDGERADFTYSTEDKKLAAGTHTVRAVYSGSDGLNGTEESTEITIQKKELTPEFVNTYSKVYDGTTAADPGKCLRLSGSEEGDEITFAADAEFTDPNAGTEKTIQASNIRLTGIWDGYYALTTETLTTTGGVITKYADAKPAETDLYISKNEEKIYEIDLNRLIPEVPEGMSIGSTYSFTLGEIKNLGAYYDESKGAATVEGDTLNLPIQEADSEITDGQIQLTFESGNVAATDCIIHVYTKITGAGEPQLSTDRITYGQKLGEIELSGSLKDADQTIAGTFRWQNPDSMPAAGSCSAEWIYTPEDTERYEEVKGISQITVAKKDLTVSVNLVKEKEYDGTTAARGTLKLDGAVEEETPTCEGTFAWTSASAGTDTVNITGIQFTGAGASDFENNYSLPENLENQLAGAKIQPKALTEDMFAELSDVTYTGKAQEPALTVQESLLTADDYTVAYSNNKDAGEATVTVTGKGNFTGELELHFDILPADFTYSVAGGNVKIGNGLDRISVSETAAGVNGEQVEGTLTWYEDEAYSQEAGEDYVFAGSEGDRVTLYWKYTPAEGQTNYSADPLKGQTEFTLQAKTVPVIRAESYSKDYDGKAVTLEDLTATASAVDGDTKVKGTWEMADPAPVLKDAGSYEVELIFTPEDTYNYVAASMNITVEIRKLDATVSLRLSTNRITTEDPLPEAKVVYTGVLKGESLTPETTPAISGMPEAAAAGAYTVRWENSEEILAAAKALAAAKNYNLTADTVAETLTITGNVVVLPQPEAPAGTEYRLEMETGISKVPDSLKEKFETAEKLQEALIQALVEKMPGTSADNSAAYDVKLYISTDDGRHWVEVTEVNFPAEGVAVTLPYPEGTGKATHDFTVAHMFTIDANGRNAGDIEYPAVTKTDEGIRFRVTSLSPVAVSWKEAAASGGEQNGSPDSGADNSGGQNGAASTGSASVATGDSSPIAVYVILLLVAVAGIIAALIVKNRKKK